MPLVKMTEKDIKQFQPKEPSIDPYSSLEDVGDTGDEEKEPQSMEKDTDIDVALMVQYYMRERKPVRQRTSSKPLRENRTLVNYADMISSDQESHCPKRQKKHPQVSTTPSSSRMAAQEEICRRDLPKGKPSTPIVPGRRFTTKAPSRSTPVHRRKP